MLAAEEPFHELMGITHGQFLRLTVPNLGSTHNSFSITNSLDVSNLWNLPSVIVDSNLLPPMKFRFRLQPLLTLRKQERDVLQQSLAIARKQSSDRIADRDKLVWERDKLLEEIRSMNNDPDEFSTEQIIVGQRYAEHLVHLKVTADAAVEQSGTLVNHVLKQLLAAEQVVRALEKLAERQLTEFTARQAASEWRDLDDASNSQML